MTETDNQLVNPEDLRTNPQVLLMRQLMDHAFDGMYIHPADKARVVAAIEESARTYEPSLVACICGKLYGVVSYGAGFIDATGRCHVCMAQREPAAGMPDQGPWQVTSFGEDRITIQSIFGTEAAVLELSGNFTSPRAKRLYASKFASCLNALQ